MQNTGLDLNVTGNQYAGTRLVLVAGFREQARRGEQYGKGNY